MGDQAPATMADEPGPLAKKGPSGGNIMDSFPSWMRSGNLMDSSPRNTEAPSPHPSAKKERGEI